MGECRFGWPRRLCRLVSIAVLLGTAATAHAESIAILGLASDDDEELAEALTSALRTEAARDPAVTLSNSRASLSQMTMAQDCDVSDAHCRARIGHSLGVDQVIYGAVRRSSASAFEAQLFMFATRGGPQANAARVVPASDATGPELLRHARMLLNALRGEPQGAGDAETAAPRTKTVAADVQPLQAEAAPPVDREAPPSSARRSSDDWAGYTLLGLASVSAGLTIFSWTQIHGAGNDDSLIAYRKAVGTTNPAASDVCSEANHGATHGLALDTVAGARDACSRGKTYEALQYVFLGVAAVATGVGTYFLVNDDKSARPSERGVSVRPSVGRRLAGVRLELRF